MFWIVPSSELTEIDDSQENYSFLQKIRNPHVVANYWIKLLNHLPTPLIPTEYYEGYVYMMGSLSHSKKEIFEALHEEMNDSDS